MNLINLSNLPYNYFSTSFLTNIFNINIVDLEKISNIFRNVFYTLAICIGAVWSYYVFIKGRTFTPKLCMSINAKGQYKNHNNLILFRFRVKNSGKTTIYPRYLKAQFYSGKIENGTVGFTLFNEISNVLSEYSKSIDNSKNEKLTIEPNDEFNIDQLIFNKNNFDIYSDLLDSIIMVKLFFVDNVYRVWREIVILDLNEVKGNIN